MGCPSGFEMDMSPEFSRQNLDSSEQLDRQAERRVDVMEWQDSIKLQDDADRWVDRIELSDDAGDWQESVDLPPAESAPSEDDDTNDDTNKDNPEGQVYPCEVEEGGKKRYYDSQGNLYRIEDQLLPNNTYEINGYIYKTDEFGRIISAEGKLHLKGNRGKLPIKDSMDAVGKGDQKEGDDRGHLIGDQFDGSNRLENLIPQDAHINEVDFKNLENELAQEVRAGKEVYVKVEPVYEGNSRRPSAIVVTYSINGVENVRIFPNN